MGIIIIRLIAAILSSVIYSIYLSFKINQEKLETFIMFFSYTSIIYILGGVPVSIIIHMIQKRIENKYRRVTQYILETTMYLTAGGLTFLLFSIFFVPDMLKIYTFMVGALAALLYYTILLLLRFIGKLLDEIPQK